MTDPTDYVEPYGLYRLLVSVVLGGIALYTMIDSVVSVVTLIRRQARAGAVARRRAALRARIMQRLQGITGGVDGNRAAPNASLEADGQTGSAHPNQQAGSLHHNQETAWLDNVALRGVRVARTFAILKALEVFSLRTLWRQWRELALIVVLGTANGAALWYFYTM